MCKLTHQAVIKSKCGEEEEETLLSTGIKRHNNFLKVEVATDEMTIKEPSLKKKCEKIDTNVEEEEKIKRLGITKFCKNHFPDLIKAELWLAENSSLLEKQPIRPLVLTGEDKELQQNVLKALRDPMEFEDDDEYTQSREYLMEHAGYHFFSSKGTQTAVNIQYWNQDN